MPAAAARRGAWFAPENALQLLLLFVVLAPLAAALHWGSIAVFGFAALAVIPLAGQMGDATERLAARLGAGIGALLNATFGNAAELIIALAAMQRGLYDVVKASLTGSIIGNVLLVTGLACCLGGIGREKQSFDRAAASANSTLLALAAIGLLVPAVFHFVAEAAIRNARLDAASEAALERGLSLEIAIVLFAVYVLSLAFSLRTHRHLFAGPGHAATEVERGPLWRPVLRLLVATALVAWMSELLVGAVEGASESLGLTPVFVGVIVVAVIGNAAEHSTAVTLAIRNQMDLALNIAIGSSIQIALFVAPLLVFVSYALPHGAMNLRFTPFEVLAVGISAAVASLVSQDGESNWLEGALMLAVYGILAMAFYFLPAA
ncbi:MAG TPA: calcium/proton exchanger [Candidatus Sulfotelmatobacter sp.]|nr:calcium/proton exchanger [Candidatus Sulfotelmatobacter sp.]